MFVSICFLAVLSSLSAQELPAQEDGFHSFETADGKFSIIAKIEGFMVKGKLVSSVGRWHEELQVVLVKKNGKNIKPVPIKMFSDKSQALLKSLNTIERRKWSAAQRKEGQLKLAAKKAQEKAAVEELEKQIWKEFIAHANANFTTVDKLIAYPNMYSGLKVIAERGFQPNGNPFPLLKPRDSPEDWVKFACSLVCTLNARPSERARTSPGWMIIQLSGDAWQTRNSEVTDGLTFILPADTAKELFDLEELPRVRVYCVIQRVPWERSYHNYYKIHRIEVFKEDTWDVIKVIGKDGPEWNGDLEKPIATKPPGNVEPEIPEERAGKWREFLTIAEKTPTTVEKIIAFPSDHWNSEWNNENDRHKNAVSIICHFSTRNLPSRDRQDAFVTIPIVGESSETLNYKRKFGPTVVLHDAIAKQLFDLHQRSVRARIYCRIDQSSFRDGDTRYKHYGYNIKRIEVLNADNEIVNVITHPSAI